MDAQDRTALCPIVTYVAPCDAFGDPCSAGTGACESPGYKMCQGGQVLCSAVPGAPQAETCNGADDDCDGTPDNALEDVGLACSTGLPGACSLGHTECASGVLLCLPAILPGSLPETCDGEDEDCDGLVDEDFGAGMPCAAGVGACQSAGVITCVGPGSAQCDAVPGAPSAEGGSGPGGSGGGADGGSASGGAGSGAGDSTGSGAGGGGTKEHAVVGGCACRSAGTPASSELPWWLVAACLLPAARRRRAHHPDRARERARFSGTTRAKARFSR